MQKKNNYTDGVMGLYQKMTEKNVRSMADLKYLSKLAYDEKSIRQEDIEFAMQQDKRISLKLVTPDDGNMDTSRCAVINGSIYGIIHIDRDKKKRELYFYLQEIRKID